MIDRLNKYGICIDPTKKYAILDDIGETFIDKAVEMVKSGHKFVYVLDNIDWEEKAHDMRTDAQNKSVHAVATSIVFSRVPVRDLPDAGPQQDLKKCNVSELVKLTKAEMESVRSHYRTLVAKLLFENFPAFDKFKACIPQTTDCQHAKEMATKSNVVIMPILMKDEKKYSECVDILDQLEEWTHNIYSAAGLCTTSNAHTKSTSQPPAHDATTPTSQPPASDATIPTIGSRSRPDQPASHLPPAASEDDPLKGVKIPCYGDQLTRIRCAGAKDLRAGCHTPKHRLDHLYPFCIVDWHTKRSFLKVRVL